MSRRHWLPIPLLIAAFSACSDREAPTQPPTIAAVPPAEGRAHLPDMERLARRVAIAMHDPAFRAYVARRLDGSPYREHKLPFRRFLDEENQTGLRALAAGSSAREDSARAETSAAPGLEFYFPVKTHRVRWTGDERILVATAWGDRDTPIAFDTRGHRIVLSADQPPDIPVLALVQSEQDFDSPAALARPLSAVCNDPCDPGSGGGGTSDGGGGTRPQPVPPPPGLYLLKSHFTESFEGWLKGDPEFEFHILGQAGSTDSLTDYQCAGEHQPAPFYFDQNTLDWSGRVMLMSGLQLGNYKLRHPGQAFRILAVEDDNESCVIRTDQPSFAEVMAGVSKAYKDLTGVIDTFNVSRTLVMKTDLQKLFTLISNFILTNDELPGTAIRDSTAIELHPGYNFVIKGANNKTNGWAQLEVR
jgi:hypothetical protein